MDNRATDPLLRRHGRSLTLLMAVGAAGLVLVSVLLARLLSLDSCSLCIFQRAIYFAISGALLTAYGGWRRSPLRTGALTLGGGIAAGGMGAAGWQSWLQWFPDGGHGCRFGGQGIVEQLVEWLGQRSPTLFMATGSCENRDLVILGLSLANWSFFAYTVLLAGSVVLLAYVKAPPAA